MGCYGDPNVRTPTLDQLAAEGMKFHRFFTAAPQCVPSRASLMTGRSPVAARITRFTSPLPRDEITFPEAAAREGRLLHRRLRPHLSSRRSPTGGAAIARVREARPATFEERCRLRAHRLGHGGREADWRSSSTRSPPDKPFFLWVNFSDPHHPGTRPARIRPDPATLQAPGPLARPAGVREQLADYCAEVNRLDQQRRGQCSTCCKTRSCATTRWSSFPATTARRCPTARVRSTIPARTCRFVVRWPGVVKPGGESRALLSGEDLAPTLLAAAGLERPRA